jgi:uncharacterized protein involved in exopolysaccharide biosynthesis
MSDEVKKSEQPCIVDTSEDEIDLLELAKTIWKGRKLIIWTALALTLTTVVVSLFMTNIYTARAIIKPASQSQSGSKLSVLAGQFGGLASLAGIAMPSSASSTEIVALLESNILKKEVIENYQLLPVLLPDQWDERSKTWKKPGISLNPLKLISKFTSGESNKDPGILYTWDGIRKLEDIVNVNYNVKEDIITISVDFPDPEMAAKIVNYFIITLNEHMSSEAKRMAVVNREYLEKQLLETNDSLVQQKIYNLIAEKIETMMMAEVKEGFAFKVLDPPMAPDKKTKPKRAQIMIIAFIVSLFIGIFFVLFREYIKKIKAISAGGHHAK